MTILSIVIILFLVLESSNVFFLYFFPETKKGNGLGIFNAYHASKENPEVHALVKYLVNWIAGTKLIFIALLIVILIIGDESIKLWTVLVLILTITTFFWRLYPLIRSMDKQNQLSPKGYSKTLAVMIASFVLVFISAMIIYLVF